MSLKFHTGSKINYIQKVILDTLRNIVTNLSIYYLTNNPPPPRQGCLPTLTQGGGVCREGMLERERGQWGQVKT